MAKTNLERQREWRVRTRDRMEVLKAAKEVLEKTVHSGITVTRQTQDGVEGLYVSAKFTQPQLDALEELARMENTDAETMVQDMLAEAMLAWRRQRDEKAKGGK